MKIYKVQTPRAKIQLPMAKNVDNNRIDLLTGENGSGKTEILTALAETFRVKRKPSTLRTVEWEQDHRRFANWSPNGDFGPKRLIAQTFSPVDLHRKLTHFPQ